MIRGLFLFIAAAASWGAALWFWIKPDFGQWSQPAVLGIHAGPPVAIGLVWGIWRLIRWRADRREAAAAAEREAAADAERQAALAEARQKHEAELRHQKIGCDCRAIAMTQLRVTTEDPPAFGLEVDAVDYALAEDDGDTEDEIAVVHHLRDGIGEALACLYGRCPGAAVFPIYVLPPAEAVGEEVFVCIRQVRAEVIAELDLPERGAAEFNRILFLPSADSVANSVVGLFDSTPDLPGAIVLAFDSAWLSAMQRDDDELDPQLQEKQKWLGKPGQGVFGLLLTHPELEAMLDTAEQVEAGHDAMTPYWERGLPGSGHQMLLAVLTPDEREGLRQAPVLARVHRAAFAQFPEQRRHTTAMVRNVQSLLERAQVNASLIDCPFAGQEPGKDEAGKEEAAPECGWLVHNAGGVDRSGNRLATLGVALFNRGLSVDPIDTGTNLVVHGGDYGQARGVALLALTIARAAQEQAAALCAEFSGDDGLGLFFAIPPKESA